MTASSTENIAYTLVKRRTPSLSPVQIRVTNDSFNEDYIETSDLVEVQSFASIIIFMFLCAHLISSTPNGLKSFIIYRYNSWRDDEYHHVNMYRLRMTSFLFPL